MALWTDDPAADWDRHCAEQEAAVAKYPVCADCHEHITDEHLYEINDNLICQDCLDRYYKKWTDDYI